MPKFTSHHEIQCDQCGAIGAVGEDAKDTMRLAAMRDKWGVRPRPSEHGVYFEYLCPRCAVEFKDDCDWYDGKPQEAVKATHYEQFKNLGLAD